MTYSVTRRTREIRRAHGSRRPQRAVSVGKWSARSGRSPGVGDCVGIVAVLAFRVGYYKKALHVRNGYRNSDGAGRCLRRSWIRGFGWPLLPLLQRVRSHGCVRYE